MKICVSKIRIRFCIKALRCWHKLQSSSTESKKYKNGRIHNCLPFYMQHLFGLIYTCTTTLSSDHWWQNNFSVNATQHCQLIPFISFSFYSFFLSDWIKEKRYVHNSDTFNNSLCKHRLLCVRFILYCLSSNNYLFHTILFF